MFMIRALLLFLISIFGVQSMGAMQSEHEILLSVKVSTIKKLTDIVQIRSVLDESDYASVIAAKVLENMIYDFFAPHDIVDVLLTYVEDQELNYLHKEACRHQSITYLARQIYQKAYEKTRPNHDSYDTEELQAQAGNKKRINQEADEFDHDLDNSTKRGSHLHINWARIKWYGLCIGIAWFAYYLYARNNSKEITDM